MRRRLVWMAVVAAGLWLAAPRGALAAETACTQLGTSPMLVTELYFGRNIGGRLGVTDALWAQFAADTLTRTLPGMTVLDAAGTWYDSDHKLVVREPTKYVIAALDDAPESYAKLKTVIDAYKARFKQQSVGVTLAVKCAAF